MPFKKDKNKTPEDLTIAAQSGRRVKAGQVGLEIEVEGTSVFVKKLPPGWTVHDDGSLRGEENCEYVLSKPVNFDTAIEKVDQLYAAFAEAKCKLDDSNRTSVHVHLNVLPFHMNRLASLIALWFITEDVLTHWCGEYRVGNLFAMRAKDAPAIVKNIRDYIKGVDFIKDNHHYAALNADAIRKFGSLEFRPMRGSREPEPVKQWIRILQRLYDASERYPDPRTICDEFSLNGPLNFFYELFGRELSQAIQQGANLSDEQIRESLYEGMRYFAQEICFARDWSKFNPVKKAVNPFEAEEEAPREEGIDFGRMIRGAGRENPPVPPAGPLRNLRFDAEDWWGLADAPAQRIILE